MPGEFQAGSITSKLTLDRKQWNAAIKGVKTQTKSMGNWVKQNSAQFKKLGLAITAVGAVAAVTFTKMVKKYMETGDWIDKMSKRTGISATTLSELAYAADITGANLDLLEKGVRRMSRTIVEAGEGLESYLRAFRLIGLDLKDLQGLNPEEQFLKIGKAIGKLSDETEKAAVAQMIFGRAGTMLIPLFKEGEEGMEKLREEAHRLGIVFDAEGAARAAEFKDSMTGLKGAFQGLGFAIVKDIIPVFTQMATHFKDVFVNVRGNTQTFTESILGFFETIAMGIGGLMMAWTGLKTGVFKVSAYVAGQLEKFLYAVVGQLVILEKIPIVGKKIVPITDAIYETLKSVTAITKGYNEEGEKQIDVITNQVIFLEGLKKALNDAKNELKDFTTESAIISETIVKTSLPAARDMWGALMKLSKGYEVSAHAAEWSGETTKEMTEKQIAAMGDWAAALQGGLAGVMSAIKQMVIGEMLKALAASKLPFLAKLPLLAITVGLVEAVFAGIMRSAEGRALGGRVEEGEAYRVGERGTELFVPERSGTIIPHSEPATGRMMHPINITIAPVISNQIDPFMAKKIVRDVIIPETIEAFRGNLLLDEMKKAMRI